MSLSYVVYEVTAVVEKEAEQQWNEWIPKHVNDIVSLDNGKLFIKGIINKIVQQPTDTTAKLEFVIQYHLYNEQALETYLSVHAPKLRDEAVNLFGSKLKTSRRIYTAQQEILPQTKEFGYVF